MNSSPMSSRRTARSWNTTDEQTVVGHGPAVLDAVGTALLSWRVHELAGITVFGPPRAVAGALAHLRLQIGALPNTAPVAVTETHRDERSIGFTYRALPGHPEEGEESFAVVMDADGLVVFRLHAVSRPGTWWSRAGAPVARLVQRRVTFAYLAVARRMGDEVAAAL